MEGFNLLRYFIVVLLCPYMILGQFDGQRYNQLSYRVVNGQVYFEKPTTTTAAPSFMESWFPFLPSSYTSANSEEVDQAIFDSITGPPDPIAPTAAPSYQSPGQGSGIMSLPSFSSSGYNNQNNLQSPYISNEEDNYMSLDSINVPQYAKPQAPTQQVSGYPHQNYLPNTNAYQGTGPTASQYPKFPVSLPGYSQSVPQLPFSLTTESTPFYQPLLNLFGMGSKTKDSEYSQLPSPNAFLSGSNFPANAMQQYSKHLAQARKAYIVENTPPKNVRSNDFIDESEHSVQDVPKLETSAPETHDASVVSTEAPETKDKFPCPKQGIWRWNGEVCIALGPVPTWGCKPDDLVMSGRIGVCRNKIFFPPGSDPMNTYLEQ